MNERTNLLTAFQTRFSLYTAVHCRPDMMAFNDEKFFSRRHSYIIYYNIISTVLLQLNILEQLRLLCRINEHVYSEKRKVTE